MPLFEAFRLAFASIRVQKLKSFFSLIGVLIGVMFLIAVVSIVQGMNVYVKSTVTSSMGGVNSFQLRQRPDWVAGNVTDETWREWMRRPRISYDDADYVEANMTVPATYARFCADEVDLQSGGKVAQGIELRGTELAYFELKDYQLSSGRPFTPQEVRKGVPVVVLGSLVAEKLFAGVDPLTQEVSIAGIPYRVIGVVESQGTIFGLSLDKFAIMPFTAPGRRLICPINILDELIIHTANEEDLQAAVGEVVALMRTRRGLKPLEENNFSVQTAEEALSFWDNISKVLFFLLPGLVGISLVVGGIVIMNIMLMAVAERTREIGIRKALGARRRDILSQFIVESTTLSTAGAALGVLLGIGLAFVVKATTPLPAAVAVWSVVVGVGAGMTVGILAGVYPAWRAASLDPIVALRAE